MSQLMRFLWCIAVIMMAGIPVRGHPIADQSSNNTEDNGYYNIYSKIDSLEKSLQNLQTGVNNRNKLLQQVFLAIAEFDADPAMTDVDLKSLVLQTKSKNDTAIGFTTRLYETTYSSSSSIIRGSPILYNGGNAYNGTVFTCPSPGLYLFHVSLITNTKNNGIWIYKNTQQLTLAYSGNEPQYNGASVSAAVWLDVGDQVYLRPYTSSLFVDGISAFTGIKVN
uniref:Uncharacterized protein LOC111115723 n=1 Tax=Crassostrea virginica TaxID=6565 RepID=A0A8B8C3K9_CRAVI|nr:uncharacterized protein LOC111115723 [Crassostrea virginica]